MGTRLLLLHVREADNRAAKRNCVLHEGPPLSSVHCPLTVRNQRCENVCRT